MGRENHTVCCQNGEGKSDILVGKCGSVLRVAPHTPPKI